MNITELTIKSGDESKASMERQAERYKALFQVLTGLDTDDGSYTTQALWRSA